MTDFAVYERVDLRKDDRLQGPAIVQEDTTNLVLFSDQFALVDEYGHVLIYRGDRS